MGCIHEYEAPYMKLNNLKTIYNQEFKTALKNTQTFPGFFVVVNCIIKCHVDQTQERKVQFC